MSDNEWNAGDIVTNGCAIYNPNSGGAVVVTGVAPIVYIINDEGTTKYLQDDLSTVNTTYNAIDLSFQTNIGHAHDVTIPEAMRGVHGTFIVFDTDGVTPIHSETFEVSEGAADGDKHMEIKDGAAP